MTEKVDGACRFPQSDLLPAMRQQVKSGGEVVGVLENHWRGESIDTLSKARGLAGKWTPGELSQRPAWWHHAAKKRMLCKTVIMQELEERLEGKTGLGKRFGKIILQKTVDVFWRIR